jgi:hypothetical protein
MNWRSIPETNGYRFVSKLIDRPAGPIHRSIAVTYVHQTDRRWSLANKTRSHIFGIRRPESNISGEVERGTRQQRDFSADRVTSGSHIRTSAASHMGMAIPTLSRQ